MQNEHLIHHSGGGGYGVSPFETTHKTNNLTFFCSFSYYYLILPYQEVETSENPKEKGSSVCSCIYELLHHNKTTLKIQVVPLNTYNS